MILELGEKLKETCFEEIISQNKQAVFIISAKEGSVILDKIGMKDCGDIGLHSIGFNKIEFQQDYIVGTLYIPMLSDIYLKRYCIQFFVNQQFIVIVDDGKFADSLVEKIIMKKSNQGDTKSMFLYNFFIELLSGDLEVLGQYEKTLMRIEENIVEEKGMDYRSEFNPIRKKLLTLRGYYNEVSDMGKEFEEDEIELFSPKERRLFGIVRYDGHARVLW